MKKYINSENHWLIRQVILAVIDYPAKIRYYDWNVGRYTVHI